MSWIDDSFEDDAGAIGAASGGGVGCSECGYDGANGDNPQPGDSCPCCGEGTILSDDDFSDKFGKSASDF